MGQSACHNDGIVSVAKRNAYCWLLVATISRDRAIVCFVAKDRTRGNCTKDKGCKEYKWAIVAVDVAQFRNKYLRS